MYAVFEKTTVNHRECWVVTNFFKTMYEATEYAKKLKECDYRIATLAEIKV